ncbi:MAG: RNA polymerase sporulation sigma factor SigE [Clostridia bacterium]|nr:RNA polymerase sporulation sigma factor SigE [Clostridia bacterium]
MIRLIQKIKQFFIKLWAKRNVLFFISSQEALPTPLSVSEEKEVMEMLKTDRKNEAKTMLIERNLRLVVYIARKFENSGNDLEDLISIGSLGLIKAVNSFDPDKNIKLATYASRCIENEILMQLRKSVRTKCEISFDEPLNVDYEGNELLVSDILGTDPDVVSKNLETEIEKQLLHNAIEKLNNREKNIMTLRFGLGGNEEKTQKEVADLLGISQSYISRLEKKIIIRLKKEMAKVL